MALRDWLKKTEQYKSENCHHGPLPKLTKPLFEKKATDHDRITRERIFNFLADQGRACSESEIMAAAGGDRTYARNILYRLAAEGVIAYLGGGLYQVDAPKVELPEFCPLQTGGPSKNYGMHPKNCGFHPKFLGRMLQTGTLIVGGACPLARVCTHTTTYDGGKI